MDCSSTHDVVIMAMVSKQNPNNITYRLTFVDYDVHPEALAYR